MADRLEKQAKRAERRAKRRAKRDEGRAKRRAKREEGCAQLAAAFAELRAELPAALAEGRAAFAETRRQMRFTISLGNMSLKEDRLTVRLPGDWTRSTYPVAGCVARLDRVVGGMRPSASLAAFGTLIGGPSTGLTAGLLGGTPEEKVVVTIALPDRQTVSKAFGPGYRRRATIFVNRVNEASHYFARHKKKA